jgi:hypothetical protein
MSHPDQPPQPPPAQQPQGQLVRNCAYVGVVVGIVAVWLYIGPTYFPPPEDGSYNWKRLVAALAIAVLGGVIGGAIGKTIEAMRKK